ncbi:unnamed protein product [Blepharisma stoltei]|uniref:Uncharacterized protein n=1 Tax=Blepharisma stoltei TaxID=1481888 RepID=A0AAU9JS45_9CILI|nr:unnamed protein product [Blepharisma stoltei]
MGCYTSKSKNSKVNPNYSLSKYVEVKSLTNNKLYFTKRSDIELLKSADQSKNQLNEESSPPHKQLERQKSRRQKFVRCQILN